MTHQLYIMTSLVILGTLLMSQHTSLSTIIAALLPTCPSVWISVSLITILYTVEIQEFSMYFLRVDNKMFYHQSEG